MPGLTCIVPTLNEAANISDCLATLQFADEVLVVDSLSTDGTPDLAAQGGARVLLHEHTTPTAQRNWAIQQATHEWVAIIDADERVRPALAQEMRAAVESGAHDGYLVQRENYFLGHRIRYSGWQNDWVLRLFRQDKGAYPERTVHERAEVDGSVGRLRELLVHYTYRTLDDYWMKMRRFAWQNAQGAREHRPVSGLYLALHPPLRFLRAYLLKGGFLDGRPGLMLSLLTAMYATAKDAHVWELQQQVKEGIKPR